MTDHELQLKKDILFDLDGTLSDNSEGIIAGVRHALRRSGTKVPNENDLGCFIGPPLDYAFGKFCKMSDDAAAKAVVYYREYYREHGIFANVMYDGIPEMLSKLKSAGRRLFIATSKPEEFSRKIASHFGIDSFFDFIGGADFEGVREHKVDVIRYVISTCGIDPDNAAMIGDRMYDIDGAIRCGITPVGVLYGFGSREELENAGAVAVADQPSDIVKLFL